jgi:hypothetical protein
VSLVGKIIDAYCTKCKLMLAHVVLSEMSGTVGWVECKTCGAQYLFRRGIGEPKPGPKKRMPTLSRREESTPVRRNTTNETALLWENRYQGLDPETPILDYHIQDEYRSKDVIRHPVFGIGFVERIVSQTRVYVLFKDAVKLLAMNVQ